MSDAFTDLAVCLFTGRAECLWDPSEPDYEAVGSLLDLVDNVTGETERGRAALEALSRAPGDEKAREEARVTIDAALAADPAERTEALRLARLVPADLVVLVDAQGMPPATAWRSSSGGLSVLVALVVVGVLVLAYALGAFDGGSHGADTSGVSITDPEALEAEPEAPGTVTTGPVTGEASQNVASRLLVQLGCASNIQGAADEPPPGGVSVSGDCADGGRVHVKVFASDADASAEFYREPRCHTYKVDRATIVVQDQSEIRDDTFARLGTLLTAPVKVDGPCYPI